MLKNIQYISALFAVSITIYIKMKAVKINYFIFLLLESEDKNFSSSQMAEIIYTKRLEQKQK